MAEAQAIPCTVLFVTREMAPTIGHARNMGIYYARKVNAEWIVQWDDDNYYGPGYVRGLIDHGEKADLEVVSAGLGFVRDGEELWHFPSAVGFYPGHSTAVRARSAHLFHPISLGEDVQWSLDAKRRWLRGGFVEPWGLVYDRTGDGHAYNACNTEFLRSFGPAIPLGKRRNEFVDMRVPLPTGPLVRASNEAVFRMIEKEINGQVHQAG